MRKSPREAKLLFILSRQLFLTSKILLPMVVSCGDSQCKWEINHYTRVKNNTTEVISFSLNKIARGSGGKNVTINSKFELKPHQIDKLIVYIERLENKCTLKEEPFEYNGFVHFQDEMYDNFNMCYDAVHHTGYQINSLDSDCQDPFKEVSKGCFHSDYCW